MTAIRPSQQRAHRTYVARRRADGWTAIMVWLSPHDNATLDAQRLVGESRSACLRRILDQSQKSS